MGFYGFHLPFHAPQIGLDASSEDKSCNVYFRYRPLEPQPDGVSTVFPFWVQGDSDEKGYVELPYTLPQDFTIFVLMKERSVAIWKQKLDWIAEKGGMALLNTHPDYMDFGETKPGIEEYPVNHYREFLKYLTRRYEGRFWHVLPRRMAQFWSTSSSGSLFQKN